MSTGPARTSFEHRSAGATEVLVVSGNRWALMHELRGAPEPPLPVMLAKLSAVDLVLVEGFKRESFPKLEVHRAENGKPLLHPDDSWIVAVASDTPLPDATVPVVDLNDIDAIADLLLAQAIPIGVGEGTRGRPLMAQLTDDCFAFSGPLLPVDDLERIIRERITPVAEIETVALALARGRTLARDVKAPIDLPPFDNSAVDGYAVRHADLSAQSDTALAVADRITAGRAAAHPIAPGTAIRIFTGAPMPEGADTVFMQEDVRTEGGTVIVPPGLKPGSNRRLAGEDIRAGSVALPAGRVLSIADIALAVRARAHRTCRASAHSRCAVLDRRRTDRARPAAGARVALRCEPHPARRADLVARRERHRSRHPAGRSCDGSHPR